VEADPKARLEPSGEMRDIKDMIREGRDHGAQALERMDELDEALKQAGAEKDPAKTRAALQRARAQMSDLAGHLSGCVEMLALIKERHRAVGDIKLAGGLGVGASAPSAFGGLAPIGHPPLPRKVDAPVRRVDLNRPSAESRLPSNPRPRAKMNPSRSIGPGIAHHWLVPNWLRGAVTRLGGLSAKTGNY
jgi:hypothetical protein